MTRDVGSNTEGPRAQTPARRFFGVQWRLLVSHLEVALVAALLPVALVTVALTQGRRVGLALIIGGLGLLASVVAGAWLALYTARDLKLRLREASRFASALARGDYRWRISLNPDRSPTQVDEIDQLGEELNGMADSLESAIDDLKSLAERNRALAEESGRLAALEERTRLARDLHDTVNQQVFSLSMQAASARRRLESAGADPDRQAEVSRLLMGIEELARSAHRQMRDLILELRPTTLEQQGVGPALAEYVKAFTESEGLECDCRVECTGRFGQAVEEALFRIAQEALNNVAKHSEATAVTVRLFLDPARRVVLAVRDNGRGFDPAKAVRPTALGFRGLRERAGALGGRVKIDSSPGQGTTVTVSFPTPASDKLPSSGSREET
ncbi:MAG: sensor histidine kinase [Bacillota bacterium]|nr:MAG: sensor histidine kinase [Bacillota bacterium]